MNSVQLGFVRGLGVTIVLAICVFLGDASHLNGIVSDGIGALIAALALSLEHYIEGKTDKALFGAVRRK